MTTIVVGIDGSPASEVALQWVVEYTSRIPATVRLVTVLGDSPFGSARAERGLRAAAGRLAGLRPALPIEQRLVRGLEVPETLARESADADLLVIGHRRRRLVRSLLAGALPLRIAEAAECPVVIVPHDWLRRSGKTVTGVVFDGSSAAAIRFAAAESAAFGRALDIVHVEPDADWPGASVITGEPDEASGRSADIGRMVADARTGRPDLAVRTFSVRGRPDRILRAHARQAALVVVGSHRSGALRAVLGGSRAYDLMNGTPAPLCVVPPGFQRR